MDLNEKIYVTRVRTGHGWTSAATWMLAPTVTGSGLLFADSVPAQDLSETFVPELMQVEVTSAAKRSIAEVPRFARRLRVARVDVQKYVIPVRGFIGEFSYKVLVLIDGRSGFGGVSKMITRGARDTIEGGHSADAPVGLDLLRPEHYEFEPRASRRSLQRREGLS